MPSILHVRAAASLAALGLLCTLPGAPSAATPAALAAAPTAKVTIVHRFQPGQGYAPFGSVLVAADGTIYGTNSEGGRQDRGLVFKLSPTGVFTVLHEFGSVDGDGTEPESRLTFGSDGLLYGTTPNGGANQHGVVYRVATDGSRYEIVHTFAAGFSEGALPLAELFLASDGNLYGTTQVGGDSPECGPSNGCGTVFRIGADGSFAQVHSFTDAEGDLPSGGFVQLSDGRLAGMLGFGGPLTDQCHGGCGALFTMTLAGDVSISHHFDGFDGRQPLGTPVLGAHDTLYGITRFGGKRHFGAEFHVDAAGTFHEDAHFNCQHDACRPNVGLSPAPERVSSTDGIRGSGLVNHNAQLIVANLVASSALTRGPDGALYGTAEGDGSGGGGRGVIFRLELK